MSRLLYFFSDQITKDLARWERSAQSLELNLSLLKGGRHPDASVVAKAENALRQVRSHLRLTA